MGRWRRFTAWIRALFRRKRPPGYGPEQMAARRAHEADRQAAVDRAQAKEKRPKTSRPTGRQVPVTEADIERLGLKPAVDRACAMNEMRLQATLVKTHDGQLYYRAHDGQWRRTDGRARALPDGTMRMLPPAPRPSKRERAKLKRNLKRKEKAQ